MKRNCKALNNHYGRGTIPGPLLFKRICMHLINMVASKMWSLFSCIQQGNSDQNKGRYNVSILVQRHSFLHFVKWSEQRSTQVTKDQLVVKSGMIRKKQNQVKGILHYIAPLLLLYSKCKLTQSIPHTHSQPLSAGNIGDIALCTRYIIILPTMHTQFLKHLLCKCKVTH